MGSEVRQVSRKVRGLVGAERCGLCCTEVGSPSPCLGLGRAVPVGGIPLKDTGEKPLGTGGPRPPSGLDPAYALSPRMLSLAPKAQRRFHLAGPETPVPWGSALPPGAASLARQWWEPKGTQVHDRPGWGVTGPCPARFWEELFPPTEGN